jgi:Lar family restriction alleviation protein
MEKLKPCPFCGGSDIDIRTDDAGLSWYSFCNGCGVSCGYSITKDDVMNAWNMRVPTVEPVKHGKWIEIDIKDYKALCSECGTWSPVMGKFCPECGARMDGE